MSAPLMIGGALLALSALLMLAHLASVALYLYRLGRPVPQISMLGQPEITLLRPVCGVDQFDAETLNSSFLQDYPAYQVIFCAETADDPAVALVQRLMAAHPHLPAQLLIGQDEISGNPKLNNVWKGWQAAQTDWICMTDSNLLLPPDYLSLVVNSWGPRTGLVSTPPIGTRPDGFAAMLECAFLNGNQARLQYAAASLGQGFAQGKTLFFNRPLIESAGGLAALGRNLAEDATATQLVRAMGREVSLVHLPFAQPIGKRSLAQVWQRQLRWSRIRRDAFEALFLAEIFNGGVLAFVITLLGLLATGAAPGLLLGYVGLWYLAEAVLAYRAGWSVGPQAFTAGLLRDLWLPAIWVTTFLQRGFDWRGACLTAPTDIANSHDRSVL